MQTLSCSAELPGWPSTPREAQRAALAGEVILTEMSSAGEVFSKQVINLNLPLTKNIPVSRGFGWSWGWFGYCCSLLGWQCLGREKWRVLHKWEWGCRDGDMGSPASKADGALPNQAVIQMRVGSRLWGQLAPCPSCPAGSCGSTEEQPAQTFLSK